MYILEGDVKTEMVLMLALGTPRNHQQYYCRIMNVNKLQTARSLHKLIRLWRIAGESAKKEKKKKYPEWDQHENENCIWFEMNVNNSIHRSTFD